MRDEYLIRHAQAGDKNALEKLIRRYYDKIYSYCFHHVNDCGTAEDICQETFCSVLEHLDKYRHYDKFQNYLYVVAGNKCKDFFKKKKPLYFDDIPEGEVKEADGQFPKDEDMILMKELVHQLPRELEEVIILRFYQELKYQDIAGILQISNSLVKYRVKKAIECLRSELEKGES